MTAPWSREDFTALLRDEGKRRYHDRHPFHVRMNDGQLTQEELRRWVANRWHYQTRIPVKDALILAKSDDPAFRRAWVRRLHDHDGQRPGDGGLAQWARLAEALGVGPEELESGRAILPGVRFACDADVTLVREASLVEAVASSLTEFSAPDRMARRYPWIPGSALDTFGALVPRDRRDADDALAFVAATATTREQQDRCVAALVRKTEILWHLLDCVDLGTVLTS